MDFRRHVTAGRISELLGERTVDSDMFIRTMGWREVASPRVRPARTRDPRLPRRLQRRRERLPRGQARHRSCPWSTPCSGSVAVGYQPEKWTPVDSLAWLKAMAWDLRGNMDDEIARTRLSLGRTSAQVDELYPRFPYERHEPIVPTTGSGPSGSAARAGARAGGGARPGRRTPRRRRHPRADGPWRRHRLEQLGGLGRAHGLRQAAAGERPAPGHLHPGGLVPDGAALPDGQRRLPVRRQWVHVRRHARRGDRPQPRHRLGDDQPRRGRQRPLPGEDHRQDLSLRRPPGCRWPSATR